MAASNALNELVSLLRAEGTVISPQVRDPVAPPALGMLAAARRTDGEGTEYALVVESVREGYLLHYGEGRIVSGADRDLALLAGDYLYALGLERLAALSDLAAVRELSDLITLAAQIHDTARAPERARAEAAALWLGSVVAIAADGGEAHEEAKSALRAGSETAAGGLWRAARETAEHARIGEPLREAAFSIDFRPTNLT